MQYFVAFSNTPSASAQDPPEGFERVMDADQARVRALYAEGRVVQAWAFDRPERGGALLIEAASTEELEQVIATIPLVASGFNDYQAYPLAPYPGFSTDV